MQQAFLSDLVATLGSEGFRVLPDPAKAIANAEILLTRRTWNTNRAIIVVSFSEFPADDFRRYLRRLRRQTAFRCGFFPFFWGIGIQVIVVAPGLADGGIDPAAHVARFDNQWAIVQSIFLVDPVSKTYRSARTWGQVVTGKFQDAIANVLARVYRTQLVPATS